MKRTPLVPALLAAALVASATPTLDAAGTARPVDAPRITLEGTPGGEPLRPVIESSRTEC